MREALSAYPSLVRSSAQVALTYRGRMVVGFLTGFFPLLLMAVWLTVVAGGGPPRGWTAGDFLAYYCAAAVMWHLSGQHVLWEWDRDMRSGDLSTRLLRPLHPFHQYVSSDLGYRVVATSVLVPVLVLAAVLLPGLDYDLTPLRAAGTAVAVVVAYLVSVLLASVCALVGFWTTQTTNLWMLVWGLGSFASGWVAPLDLMPEWLRAVALVLPFRTTLGFPVELLTGRLDGGEVLAGLAVGLAWLAVLATVYAASWRRAVRRYQAVAG